MSRWQKEREKENMGVGCWLAMYTGVEEEMLAKGFINVCFLFIQMLLLLLLHCV